MEKTDYALVQDQSALRKKVTRGVAIFVSIFAIGLGAGVITQEVLHNNEKGHNVGMAIGGDVGSCYGVHLIAGDKVLGDSSVCPGKTKTEILIDDVATTVKFDIPAAQCFSNITYLTNQTLPGSSAPASMAKITVQGTWIAAKLNESSYDACTTGGKAAGVSMKAPTSVKLDLASLHGATGLPKDNTTIINSLS
ncbi:hypothetical protein ACHHYP_15464 [Achlya hypogyna]|uniref:Uncharacterized protein n=1 Tax=Achlya hypogyna TaxID=1202772 RepID=A0A1V9YAV6_ACHHY|nr:hypothetical protein ACHHYP_15464 [Achlya hypogyna]